MAEPQQLQPPAPRRLAGTGGLRLVVPVLAVLAGTLFGCSDTDQQARPDELEPVRILRPNPENPAEEAIPRRDGLPVVAETDRLVGLIINPYDLEVGQCFNSYLTALGENQFEELTTMVDCSEPHDGEVYFQIFHPGDAGEPYPGEDELQEWAQQHCYEQFEGFVGQEYELSELDIGIMQPTAETWTDPVGRHRQVTCYVDAWRGGRLMGSMRLSGF